MIRVKAYRVRETGIKLIFSIGIIIFIYVFVVIALHILSKIPQNFNWDLLMENIPVDELNKRNNLKIGIIEKELPVENKLQMHSYSDIVIAKQGEDITDENIASKAIKEDETDFLSYDEIATTTRPRNYEVKEVSSNKIQVGKAYINNQSGIKLDLKELTKVSDVAIDDNTSVLIYHTHTSEAYEEVGTVDNFRSTDDTYNVVSVGNTLAENLKLKKFTVLHDITKHDTPSYNGAYNASLETVENIFQKMKYQIVIDLHRDALSGNLHFRPTTQINGETVSKLMFVIGTNGSGLEHDNWMNNLKLALLIQNTGEEMYPGLFRDLNLAKYRYNQHLSEGAFILEVGCTGNTLNDTKTAMKYFANILSALKNR